ncbi:hypothetical protein ACRRTK_011872 [Alexandromys fortis]
MRCHEILGIGPSPLREQQMLLSAEPLSSFQELFLKSHRRAAKSLSCQRRARKTS